MKYRVLLARPHYWKPDDFWWESMSVGERHEGESDEALIARLLRGWGKRKNHRVSDQGRGPGVFDVFTARWNLVGHARLVEIS